MKNENNATQVILARKTEVLELLESGISWRRLAYLLQLPETSCRRAINSIPELAEAKRPEGYSAEIALAKSFAALKANGFQAAEVKAWIAARSSYDTARAKNAYYRQQAHDILKTDQEKQVSKALYAAHGTNPSLRFLEQLKDPSEVKWLAARDKTETEIRESLAMEVHDEETGL